MTSQRNIPRDVIPDVVTVTININGSAMDQSVQLLGIVVHKEVNKVPFARIYIRDGGPSLEDFPVSNGQDFIPGNEIEILAGYRSQDERIFKGIITRHGIKATSAGSPTLEIECRDACFMMTLGRKNKYFYDMKDSEAFSRLVSDYILEPDIEDSSFMNKELVQYNSPDWDFVVSRAEINKMVVMANDGKVTIKTPELSQAAVLSLTYGANLLEFEAEMDARDQFTSIRSGAWDPSGQEFIEKDAATPGFQEQGNLSGSDLASAANREETRQRHPGQLSQDELQAWSDSAMFRSRLSKIRGRVSFQGYAAIKPGDVVELNGMGERFNGIAFVSSVRHDIHEGTWVTHVQTGLDREWFSGDNDINAPKAAGLLPALNGLQIGLVTEMSDDPEGEHRVKVRIPAVDAAADGTWARIATLDAGSGRGTFFLPEVGDEVVVGFLGDDPRNPIILGMLHSSANAAPFTASSSNPQKGYVSRYGMKMVFDDDEKSITMETPQGNKFVLDDNAGSITLEDQYGNKIEMGSSGISIESYLELNLKATTDIKLEGVNISISPSASLALKASGGVEMNSSGSVVIKGSIVQIN